MGQKETLGLWGGQGLQWGWAPETLPRVSTVPSSAVARCSHAQTEGIPSTGFGCTCSRCSLGKVCRSQKSSLLLLKQ